MVKLPKSDMILAAFLANLFLTMIITKATEDDDLGWTDSDFCRLDGIPWFLICSLSSGAAIITLLKSENGKLVQGLIVFVASFLLNCCGFGLGFMAVYCTCSTYLDYYYLDNYLLYNTVQYIYSIVSVIMMVLASLGIVIHYLLKVTPKATILPHSDIILLGMCFHSIGGIIILYHLPRGYHLFCDTKRGLGSWLLLLAQSAPLAVLTWIKTTGKFQRLARCFLTYVGTFLLNLTLGGTGTLALFCTGDIADLYSPAPAYQYTTLVLHYLLAIAIMFRFLIEKPDTATNAVPYQPPYFYPTQPNYPPEAYLNPPEAAFDPPEASFDPPKASFDPPKASFDPS